MSRILIVDDQQANVSLLEAILRGGGYTEIRGTTDPRDVEGLVGEYEPDIILLDLMMPHLDGFELMTRLAELVPPDVYLPVVVLTADVAPETKTRALRVGAHDFLTKPLDHVEVLLRIRNLLQTRALHVQLAAQNRLLDERVRERTKALEKARVEILDRLASAAEFRDDETGQHTARVGITAAAIAQAMDAPDDYVEVVRRAAPLHDVGKIAIPDAILLKPGRLDEAEWTTMQTHAPAGACILAGSEAPVLQVAERIALCHHEWWGGGGYPHGTSGADIPLEARIVAVADVFDALTHERPYKAAWPVDEAVSEIERQRGAQFDAEVVSAFRSVLDVLLPMFAEMASDNGRSRRMQDNRRGDG